MSGPAQPRGGRVVWFTGLPASGKTTLAREVARALTTPCCLLDSDVMREVVGGVYGYDDAGRDAFYAMLGRTAVMLAEQGLTVLVAATAPKRAHRDGARERAPAFVEVFVDTPLALCRERDPKGLYAAAAQDAANTVPGMGAPFEPPTAPEVRLQGLTDLAPAVALVLDASGLASER